MKKIQKNVIPTKFLHLYFPSVDIFIIIEHIQSLSKLGKQYLYKFQKINKTNPNNSKRQNEKYQLLRCMESVFNYFRNNHCRHWHKICSHSPTNDSRRICRGCLDPVLFHQYPDHRNLAHPFEYSGIYHRMETHQPPLFVIQPLWHIYLHGDPGYHPFSTHP